MQQLDLLTIRKQPAPREPVISSKVIRVYAKQNLRGFKQRQAERERLRRERYGREKPRTKQPKPEDHQNVRKIKVTYRAVFKQPIEALNPMGLKLPDACPLEVFGTGERWQAREIATGIRAIFNKLGKFTSALHARSEVERNFQERLEPWQVWGKPPNELQERMLLPGEIVDLGQGKMGWMDPEDFTHIIHQPTLPPGQRVPSAACGAKVNVKCFVNNLANVEPTCKGCAEVWKREYKDRA